MSAGGGKAPNVVHVIRAAVDRLPDSEAAQLDEASKAVAALVEALTSAREYITSELDRERQTFKGHENCSDIPAIERDLAQVDAALKAAGVEL